MQKKTDKTQYCFMKKKKKKLDTKGMFLNIIKAVYNKPTADTTTVKG